MTMTMAVAYRNLVFLATDTRRSLTLADGSVRHVDFAGGKMVPMRDGWVTGTGDAFLVEEALARVTPETATVEEVARTIGAAREKLDPLGIEDIDNTYFFLGLYGDPPSIRTLDCRGSVVSEEGATMMFSLPPGCAEIRQPLNDALRTGLGRVTDLKDLVRMAAVAFTAARAKSEHVSADMVFSLWTEGLRIDRYKAPLKSLVADPAGELRAATEVPVAARCSSESISTIHLDSLETVPTRGIRLNAAIPRPGTWTHFIDMAATGSAALFQFPGLTILANGDAVFEGEVASSRFTAPIAEFEGTVEMTAGAAVVHATAGSLLVSGDTGLSLQSPSGDITIGNGSSLINLVGGTAGVQVGGSSGEVGFYGSTPRAKPTITGSRGGNAALTSLLNELALLGLIVNNTT